MSCSISESDREISAEMASAQVLQRPPCVRHNKQISRRISQRKGRKEDNLIDMGSVNEKDLIKLTAKSN